SEFCHFGSFRSIEGKPEFSLVRKAPLHRAAAPSTSRHRFAATGGDAKRQCNPRQYEEPQLQDSRPTPPVPATIKADAPVPPGHKLVNPFAHYAAIEGPEAFFDGDYVRIDQERGWIRGKEKEPIGATEAFVAKIHEARHGHIKFPKSDGESVEHRTEPIMERPELPPCPACGNIVDEHDDKRCDWRPVVYLPLRPVTDPDDVVCFTGTGKGARRAVAQLCRVYARESADRQGKSPAITLNTWSFDNKSGGTTTWPV